MVWKIIVKVWLLPRCSADSIANPVRVSTGWKICTALQGTVEEGRGDLEILDPQKTQCSWEIHIFVRAVFLLLLNLPQCWGRTIVVRDSFSRKTLKWPLRWPPCSTLHQNAHYVPPRPLDEAPSRTLICLFLNREGPYLKQESLHHTATASKLGWSRWSMECWKNILELVFLLFMSILMCPIIYIRYIHNV